jgi:hypothetical protein
VHAGGGVNRTVPRVGIAGPLLALALAAATTVTACGHSGTRKAGYLAGTVAFLSGVVMITAAEGDSEPCRGELVGCKLGGGLMTAGILAAAAGAATLIGLVATQPEPADPDATTPLPPHPELDLTAPRPVKPGPAPATE